MHPRFTRLAAACLLLCTFEATAQTPVWPAVNQFTKPWTRWWWMGSAVDSAGIANALTTYHDAGIGGVEIAPIYGAKGFESKYVDFLSPQWMHLLDITSSTATRLHMGVDLTTGTGWPFGGPQVDLAHAAAKLELNGNTITSGNTRQKVKRAAPGGEGYTLDHLSAAALKVYLRRFDEAFQYKAPGIRSFYNDSYEVYGANWTPDMLREFQRRRGYDLAPYITRLTGKATSDSITRIKSDYRETMAELLLDNFTKPWTEWAHQYHRVTKNQAHGSPGNLLDLYATVDIPECETFGSSYFPIPGLRRDSADVRNVNPDPIMLQFAASAGHVAGHPLISCETFTWLTEHFKTSLSQCKPEVEQAWLAGVNHVFFHGTTYSPAEIPFPGWLFYAAVNFVPQNSWWSHLPGLNQYITRVQSVLQAGQPDNELLVYWPVYDAWNDPQGMDMPLAVHHIDKWLHPTPFYKQATSLQKAGYTLDFISDHLLEKLADKHPYKALIIPQAQLMPVGTLQRILALAKGGTRVIFEGLPADVPGLNKLDSRRKTFQSLLQKAKENVIITADVPAALQSIGVRREALTDVGLKFIRRKDGADTWYYIVNHTAKNIEQYIPLNHRGSRIIMLDPLRGDSGIAQQQDGKVRVQLASGESIILKATSQATMGDWVYLHHPEPAIRLKGPWQLRFSEGGPFLPAPVTLDSLVDWTTLSDTAVVSFSGKGTYTTTFSLPTASAKEYLLQLDKVYESAHIWINGQDAGIVWSIPFNLRIGRYLKAGQNEIRIEVANLMANHIRYMDQHHIPWRQYHEINFVNINYKDFDASNWAVMPSGLAGQVKMIPYN